jgi:glutathionylspermidine synthase
MHRETLKPRPDWPQKAVDLGFVYHQANPDRDPALGATQWDESVCYRFTLAQVEQIEAASEALHDLCLKAVDHIVNREPALMHRFQIPASFHAYIQASWNRRDPYWMGRFDLGYDPLSGAVKLLEYNADTPTMVIESAVFQWFWMQEVRPGRDQFNSLHEKLLDRLRTTVAPLINAVGETLYIATLPGTEAACVGNQSWSDEEYQHGLYFRDLATQAGIPSAWISIHEIGYNGRDGFVDHTERPIRFLHKLYPWEWMAAEKFGAHIPEDRTGFIEPVWKMLLSNKAILAVLWQLFPDHPNLLPAFFEPDTALGPSYIVKPLLAREGANIALMRNGVVVEKTPGTYGSPARVYQQAMDLPSFDGNTVVVCSWIVGAEPAGMILREAQARIVTDDSRVIPHYFVED